MSFIFQQLKHDSDNITEAITLKTGNNVKFLFSQFHLKSKLYNVILWVFADERHGKDYQTKNKIRPLSCSSAGG